MSNNNVLLNYKFKYPFCCQVGDDYKKVNEVDICRITADRVSNEFISSLKGLEEIIKLSNSIVDIIKHFSDINSDNIVVEENKRLIEVFKTLIHKMSANSILIKCELEAKIEGIIKSMFFQDVLGYSLVRSVELKAFLVAEDLKKMDLLDQYNIIEEIKKKYLEEIA